MKQTHRIEILAEIIKHKGSCPFADEHCADGEQCTICFIHCSYIERMGSDPEKIRLEDAKKLMREYGI